MGGLHSGLPRAERHPCLRSRSLVSTNERLLQELGQARAQHQAEVEQLHWSYRELKKTMGLCPGRPGPGPGPSPGGC